MLESCHKPEHVTLAVEGVRLLQDRQYDFSSEVSSHFVQACIRGGDITAVTGEIANFGNRIGAWLTGNAFHVLVSSRLNAPVEGLALDVNKLLQAGETAVSKGLKPEVKTFKRLLQYIDKIPSELDISGTPSKASLHRRTLLLASKRLTEVEVTELKSAFPAPPKRVQTAK